MLTKKKKLLVDEKVALIEELCAIIQHKVPPKLKNPGHFIVSSLGNLHDLNALIDSKANINLKPRFSYRKFKIRIG